MAILVTGGAGFVGTHPDVKEKLFNAGLETAGGSPEQLGAMVKTELARMGKVIKDAGIRVE